MGTVKCTQAQYRIPWIVFDRDQLQGFDDIIAEAKRKDIEVGWFTQGKIIESHYKNKL